MGSKERPILFSGPMVRALLDGRKTQTRRVVKPQPMNDPYHISVDEPRGKPWYGEWTWWAGNHTQGCYHHARCPYGAPGDVLWVREGWMEEWDAETVKPTGRYLYRADGVHAVLMDGDGATVVNKDGTEASPWRPSIHMPRKACRTTLEVVSVRVERVEDISEADAIAEGVGEIDCGECDGTGRYPDVEQCPFCFGGKSSRQAFLRLFYDLNQRAPRGTNPWVWVVSFTKQGAPR